MSPLEQLSVSDTQRRASSRATGWLTRFRFLEDFFLLRGLDIGVCVLGDGGTIMHTQVGMNFLETGNGAAVNIEETPDFARRLKVMDGSSQGP